MIELAKGDAVLWMRGGKQVNMSRVHGKQYSVTWHLYTMFICHTLFVRAMHIRNAVASHCHVTVGRRHGWHKYPLCKRVRALT